MNTRTRFLVVALAILPSVHAQTGLYTLDGGTATQTDQTYAATEADQSSVYVLNAGILTLSSPTTTKTGNSSSTTTSSQYGLNAGILASSAGTVTINGGSISTAASGANGLFATGTSSKITMTGGTITTTGSASHGVDVTYGGTIILSDVTITTEGSSASAALSTDYGGGTVTATNVDVTTAGSGSPAIYSTGDVTVADSVLVANGGACGVIDGSNAISLSNTTATSKTSGIKVFRSTSSSGTATVSVDGGSMTVTAGDGFYVTTKSGTTTANITLTGGVVITPSSGILVNTDLGSTVNLTATGETLDGALVADSTSTINASLESATLLSGAITNAALTIDATSGWIVPSASALTSLETAGTVTLGSASTAISVSGTATLGGALVISTSSATPDAGEYTLIDAGTISGRFSSLTFSPALASTQSASLSYASTTVTLTITGTSSTEAPTITTHPSSCTVADGSTATFMVAASGTGLSYQWRQDGTALAGETDPLLVIEDASSASAGSYDVVVSNDGGSVESEAATLAVVSTTDPGRLVNISTRGFVGTGDSILIAGFVVGGSTARTVLIRAAGPALDAFGVDGTLADPALTLYSSGGARLATNTGWGGSTQIAEIAAAVDAFTWSDTDSADSALVVTLAPGAYTAQVVGASGDTGIVLVEVYEVP